MTEPGADPLLAPSPSADPLPAGSRAARRKGAAAVLNVCPLLQSPDGAWRSAYASRDHRCWAITPAAQLTLDKQRQLCLTPAHAGCATFTATAGGWSDSASGVDPPRAGDSLLWPAVRSTPLALEPSRGRAGSLPATSGRAGGQTLLVALMVLAFLVLVIARTAAPSAQGPLSTQSLPVGAAVGTGAPGSPASPALTSTAPASTTPASPTPVTSTPPASSPPPSPSPTPAASNATPVPTVTPPGARHYTVQRGDTLSGIAARFGTTVAAIRKANGITDPRVIRVGKVLTIP